MLAKARIDDLIAHFQADLLGHAGINLENAEHIAVRRDRVQGKRLGVGLDPVHPPPVIDENHIERNDGVLHPHGDRLRGLIEEQHAAILWQRGAEHQSELTFLWRGGDFDVEWVRAGRGFERERSLGDGFGKCRRDPKQRKAGKRRETRRQPLMLEKIGRSAQCDDGPGEPSGFSSAAIRPLDPLP